MRCPACPVSRACARSRSPGLSVVHVYFQDGSDIYRNRQVVSERLGPLAAQLPKGIVPAMTPLTSSASTVLGIGITSDKRSLMELRTLVDWVDSSASAGGARRGGSERVRRRRAPVADPGRPGQAAPLRPGAGRRGGCGAARNRRGWRRFRQNAEPAHPVCRSMCNRTRSRTLPAPCSLIATAAPCASATWPRSWKALRRRSAPPRSTARRACS